MKQTTLHSPAAVHIGSSIKAHVPPSPSGGAPVASWERHPPTASAPLPKAAQDWREHKALQRLPFIGRTLVRLLRDVDTVLQVVTAFGGTTLHIPAERSAQALAQHPLRAYLTLQQMRRVVQYFAGTNVYIPRCSQALIQLRNVTIVRRFSHGVAEGASAVAMVRELARQYRLSDRWIWVILKTTEL